MTRSYDVAVMHDFFIDRLVKVDSLEKLSGMLREKARQGGGGYHGVEQMEIRGGNAVNLAHALGTLGLRTLLITHALESQVGLLRHTFRGLPVELRVKPLAAGLTVAVEEKVNVMLGFSGGAADFGPELLDEKDWQSLKRSKIVCSVNWAANKKGTRLLVALRKRLGKEHAIFIDPADFRDRIPEFRALVRTIRGAPIVDWVSMNEEEARAAARAVGLKSGSLGEVCKGLASLLGVVFDVHGGRVSYSSDGLSVAEARCPEASPKRLTGAGDVWDAGAIYGRLKKMDELQRLEFANAAAKIYLENPEPVPPSLSRILDSV